ncbi:MAG: DEAD/DEAH box helicase [Synechococcales cyanobacterium CRU_2_2]|nr:DEAD/DEAH box helicase [Synechococcales cyanobacterium CRU_2_2]
MNILHGTWIPETTDGFRQGGGFYLWLETEAPATPMSSANRSKKTSKKTSVGDRSRYHRLKPQLAQFLSDELGFRVSPHFHLQDLITPQYFLLPSSGGEALPSLELSRYLEAELPEQFDWQYWPVDCYKVGTYSKTTKDYRDRLPYILQLLPELQFLARHNLADVQLGADLLFWLSYTQAFKIVIFKDQYIPALIHRACTGKWKYELYPTWEIISAQYEAILEQASVRMPLSCASGFDRLPAAGAVELRDRPSLLRHFSEVLLEQLIAQTDIPAAFQKKIEGSLISQCRLGKMLPSNVAPAELDTYQEWQVWRDRITRTQTELPFYLYFVLQDPAEPNGVWTLLFQVAPKSDPSRQITLQDYWRMAPKQQEKLRQQVDVNFEQNLLLNLGYAARMYPKLDEALATDRPTGIVIDLGTAFNFLRESAWVLEDAGYKVIVPAWWTPAGRRRAKVKLRATGKSTGGGDPAKSYFSFDTLISYQYELSIGGAKISQKEWEQLVQSKGDLVHFRGQWMQLDASKMQEMLSFWQTHQQNNPSLSLMDFIKLTAEAGDEVEVDYSRDRALNDMLSKLGDSSKLEPIVEPNGFVGNLREYQKRGVSWLAYLEQLGLNGCLADDMGLGKTVQVIARLVQEREAIGAIEPTLLIAPTSVVGNWLRELGQFGPSLRAIVHHGTERILDQAQFQTICQDLDVLITSFTLARKDAKLLQSVVWRRIVLDEAQNIKNPKAAQTKAILKLKARHRLALTGTPVENRLLDLWSIFNFLNPGYLGKENQFRRNFERPVQRYNDPVKSTTLKKLVEPFILRRVKTDAAIIKDLPDKVEQKLYCNLTQEQASLYEAVIKDIEGKLEATEGIKRKGLILGALTKLKQICNHPAQFLHDGSEFSVARSHKLERLLEMTDEVIEEGESMLIFTQFREIGDALEQHLKHNCHYNTYYIHGGTSRSRREQMISTFQSPETEASIFILSLKAGGVGITLTKANHVFHFDRWWNPAVEDQATDRAFRIGQKKNVFVHKFVATGTLEEKIDKMIEDKKKLAGSVVGSDESWLSELDNDAFRQLVALNKNAVLD